MDYILTNEGAALMTKAVAGKELIFTRAETGKGYSSFPAGLGGIADRQQNADMEVSHEGSDVRITCFLTNRQLEEGYVMRQLGIYARLAGDETDTLVIVGQQYAGEMIHPYADGEAEYEFIILMKASGTSSIIVEAGAGSLVTKRELNAHVNRMDNPHGVTAEQIGLGKVPNAAPGDMVPAFSEASQRADIDSGEKFSVILGKIKKWFRDLAAAAWCSVSNNCTTTEAGTVLDGRQGTALQNQISEVKEDVAEINSNIANLKKSVADGKALIASAITSKGVSTAADAAYSVMAGNIRNIVTTKAPALIWYGHAYRVISATINVTNGKHYLIVYSAAPKVAERGWSNGGYTLTGASAVSEVNRRNDRNSNGMYVSTLILYVVATSGQLYFYKTYSTTDNGDGLYGNVGLSILQLD